MRKILNSTFRYPFLGLAAAGIIDLAAIAWTVFLPHTGLGSALLLVVLSVLIWLYCLFSFHRLYKSVLQMNQVTARLIDEIAHLAHSSEFAIPVPTDESSTLEQLEYLLEHYTKIMHHEYSIELLQRQIQLKELQTQINPHFLYNSLEAIRGSALTAGADDCAKMAEALSRFFRYNIAASGEFVSIADEIENVKNYFFIQQYRFGDRFSLQIEQEPDIDLSAYYMPKLSLQPIIENSIYHGLEPLSVRGVIILRIGRTMKHFFISVHDNGTGISSDHLAQIRSNLANDAPVLGQSHSSGIALYNVNRRLQLAYGREFGLSINSFPGAGTDVELLFPITSAPKYQGDAYEN